MDIETGLLYAATQSADVLERLRLLGVTKEDFDEPSAQRAYSFILEHHERHRELPTPTAVEGVCRIAELRDQGAATDWIMQEFVKRKLYRRVAGAVDSMGDKLRANDPHGALESIKEFAEEGHVSDLVEPASVFDLGAQVEESYLRVKEGYMGLPLPWSSLNQITMGLWPGTASYFVARPGVGKTHVAILIARECWRQGHKVLIVSPEMSRDEIAERFFVSESGVSGSNVLRGTLSDFEYAKLKSTIGDLKDKSGVWIMDSDHDLSGLGVEAAIRNLKPDIVCVDSIYMMRFKGEKTDRTTKAVDWVRTASKRYKIPFVAFHQLSRMVTKSKQNGGSSYAEAESAIALTDQILWDAHAVFIMEQDHDMKADKRLRFHVGKYRRGTWDGKPIDCHWNFETMDFGEIESNDDSTEYVDDDYDAPF